MSFGLLWFFITWFYRYQKKLSPQQGCVTFARHGLLRKHSTVFVSEKRSQLKVAKPTVRAHVLLFSPKYLFFPLVSRLFLKTASSMLRIRHRNQTKPGEYFFK